MSKELIERLKNEGDGVMSRREKTMLANRIEELERENNELAARIGKELNEENLALRAEIVELVAALEDNWNCNPCETTRQQKAFDVAQSVLAKVRKP